MIDGLRLTIDDWAPPAPVCCGCRSSISNRQSSRGVAALWLVLLSSAVAFADRPRELIEQGNADFDAGRYAEALEAYEQIGEEPDELLSAELLHNRAAASFKLGRLDDARELWVRAAGLRDEKFEAAARYNLGNCDYADALQAVQGQDAEASLELLGRAVQQYQDALKLDPELAHARANLELAAQLKKQIEDMAEQQPQSQPSSQPGEQDQQQQSSSQPSSQPSESDQQQADDSESQPQEQPGEDQQQDESQQPDTQPSPESQPTQQQAQPEAAEDEEQQEERQIVPIEMSKEEAERLLQMIRDAERQRRAILRAREAAGHEEVEKDW